MFALDHVRAIILLSSFLHGGILEKKRFLHAIDHFRDAMEQYGWRGDAVESPVPKDSNPCRGTLVEVSL